MLRSFIIERMSNVLGVNWPSLFAGAMGGLLLDCTLTKYTAGSVNPSDPTAGTSPTSTSYTCKGTSVSVTRSFMTEDQVRMREFEAIVLLGTMSSPVAPDNGDVLIVPDPDTGDPMSGVVSKVEVDPGGASAMCKCIG